MPFISFVPNASLQSPFASQFCIIEFIIRELPMSEIKLKGENFRKELRREQINDYFKKIRNQIITNNYSNSHQKQSEIVQELGTLEEADVHDEMKKRSVVVDKLRKIWEIGQTLHGITILKKAQTIDKLAQFLKVEYLNSEEQFYASYTIGNLFYIADEQAPSLELILMIFQLLVEANQKIRINCLNALTHILSDYPDLRERLLLDYNLIDRFINLFNSDISFEALEELLKAVYHSINKSSFNNNYKKLTKYIYRIILNTNERNHVVLAVNCLYKILMIYPNEIRDEIKKSHVLEKIIKFGAVVEEKKYTYFSLEYINVCKDVITISQFKDLVIPFIRSLKAINFEIGKTPSQYTAFNIKLKAYRLLYEFLMKKMDHILVFVEDKLYKMMIEEFEEADNPQTLEELAYVFTLVLMNGKDTKNDSSIWKLIEKASRINDENYEFLSYLKQFEESYQKNLVN